MPELGGVAHLDVAVDRVVVSPTDAFPFDEPCLDEVGEDSLGGAFGDSDVDGDVAESDLGVVGDAKEHLGVVGDEAPAALGLLLSRAAAVVARIRGLITEGKVNDPTIVAFVQSLEERLAAGQLDEITEAQLGRLVELSRERRDHSGDNP